MPMQHRTNLHCNGVLSAISSIDTVINYVSSSMINKVSCLTSIYRKQWLCTYHKKAVVMKLAKSSSAVSIPSSTGKWKCASLWLLHILLAYIMVGADHKPWFSTQYHLLLVFHYKLTDWDICVAQSPAWIPRYIYKTWPVQSFFLFFF